MLGRVAIRIVHRSDSPQLLGEVVTAELRHRLLARLAKGDPFYVNHDDSRRVVSPAHIEAVYDGDDTIWFEGLGELKPASTGAPPSFERTNT